MDAQPKIVLKEIIDQDKKIDIVVDKLNEVIEKFNRLILDVDELYNKIGISRYLPVDWYNKIKTIDKDNTYVR